MCTSSLSVSVSHRAVGDFMSRPAAACHPAEGKSDMSSSLLPSIKPEEKQIDAGQLAHFAPGLLKWKVTGSRTCQHCSSREGEGSVSGTACCDKSRVS